MVLKACLTLAATLIALNAHGWRSPALGLIAGGIYLASLGYLWGGWMTRIARGWYERMALGLLLALSGVSILGSLLFYLAQFSNRTALVLLFVLPWFGRTNKATAERTPFSVCEIVVGIISLVLAGCTLFILASSGTDEAIRTPWNVVPPVTFLLYAALAAAVITLTRLTERSAWLVPFYVVTLALLPLVYTYGYGFDPHIHQATEAQLAMSGTISPKPLYYLGQYVDVTWLSATLGLPVATTDTWFLILLASLVLPALIASLARAMGAVRPWTLLLTLVPLTLTLPGFTYTTPQGLSYLYAVAAFLLVALRLMGAQVPRYAPWLVAVAATCTQPITGLPLLAALGLWWLAFENPNLLPRTKFTRGLTAAGTALAVPLAFTVLSWLKPELISLRWRLNILPALEQVGQDIMRQFPFLPSYVEPVDAVYLWGRPLALLALALAAIGAWYVRSRGFHKLLYCAAAAGLFASSYLVLRLFVVFTNLAINEQGFYSARLMELAFYSLWPLAFIGAYATGTWLLSKLSPATFALGGALVLTASFYLTYPRLDAWHKDTAYNSTRFDQAAVTFVEQEASAGLPYVALANQAVSATAVKALGFDHYRGGNYFYPLPTGGNPLYRVYLNAAQDGLPTREVLAEAARLGQVPQVFLILNRYWADYETLTRVAQTEADAHWELSQGRLSVYRYDF